MSLIKFNSKGIFCTDGDFYVDPWRSVKTAVITHAHADHARSGMEKYICHPHTAAVLRERIGENIQIVEVDYNTPFLINEVMVSLHPAGHVVGSAQVRIEKDGFVTVVSGDYKRQNDGISQPFEPLACNEFVTESTFGLPIYNWQPENEMRERIVEWARANKQKGQTSVFTGYSLGKAQRLMKILEAEGELYVHSSIAKINDALTTTGVSLPSFHVLDLREKLSHLKGEIIIIPPILLDNKALQKIPNRRIAICSGWMHVRGARRWRSADAGFSISDHADWPGLLQTIKETQAQKVFVTHGYTHQLARYLNEIGIDAEPVSTHFDEAEEN